MKRLILFALITFPILAYAGDCWIIEDIGEQKTQASDVYSAKSDNQLFLAPTSSPNGCAITINGTQISVPMSKIKSLSSNPGSGQISLELLDGTIGNVGYAKCPSTVWAYRLHFQSAFGEGDILLDQVRTIKRCESAETTNSHQQTKRIKPDV
jgi:hypothetical protein